MAETKGTNSAKSIRDEALRLVNEVDKSYYKLGGILSQIADGGQFKAWGYDTFEEYVEGELGFQRRKAYYLIRIFQRASELEIPVADLERIGWTKARSILSYDTVVKEKSDFDEWATRAVGMNVSTLAEALHAAALGKPAPKKGKDADGNPTVEIDGELFHTLKIALADAQYANVKLALTRAGEIAKSDKIGHLIDMICLDFLANNAEVADMGDKLAAWVNKGLIEVETEDGSGGLTGI